MPFLRQVPLFGSLPNALRLVWNWARGERSLLSEQSGFGPSIRAYRNGKIALGERATLDDLWACYRLLLNRVPDERGFAAYSNLIRRGIRLEELVRFFTGSPEFTHTVANVLNPSIKRARLDEFDLYVPEFDAVVGEAILQRADYEPHVTKELESVLKEGDTFVDIGANIGYFSVLASRIVGESGRVYSVEPMARNVKLLLANKALNNADNMIICPYAVAETECILTLMSMGSIASSRDVKINDLLSTNSFEFCYARALDDVIQENWRVNVLKTDADGYDYMGLRGASRILTTQRPTLFAEFAPEPLRECSRIEPIEYLRFIKSFGYDEFTVLRPNQERLQLGSNIDRIAEMPRELNTTHVDLRIE